MAAVEWETLKWVDWFNNRYLSPSDIFHQQKQKRGTMHSSTH